MPLGIMFCQIIYRHLLYKMACFFVNLIAFFRSRLCIFDLCARPGSGRGKYPVQPGMHDPNIAVENAQDLAQQWFRFNFAKDMAVFKQMMDRFGTKTVLRTKDLTDRTVCHWIADRGTKEALNYVAECDPSIVNVWIEDDLKPMVHMAMIGNNIEVLDALLQDYGLDINFRNHFGQNAMMHAINSVHNIFSSKKSYDIILWCHIYGIKVTDSNTETGQTALHYAVQRFYEQDVHLLLRLGASTETKDRWGHTAYDYAVRSGNKKFAKLLEPSKASHTSGLKERISQYFRLLRRSAHIRNQQVLKWSGMFFSIGHSIFFFCYLLPMYFMYYVPYTINLAPLHVILTGCILLMITSGLLTVFGGSNFIPTRTGDYDQLIKYLGDDNESASKRCKTLKQLLDDRSYRLCHVCQCIGPEHSKHCYLCGRCSFDHDHHCVFLHTCIGEGNIRWFILFTFTLGICGALGLMVVGYACLLQYRSLAHESITWYFKAYKMFSIFNAVNAIVCFKFTMAGLSMTIATVVKRNRNLMDRQKKPSSAENLI